MPASQRPFTFICGQDDFLVGRLARARYEEMSKEAQDEFSREVVDGFSGKVDDVQRAVGQFREAVQTVPMFGGRRVVWLKDVNFLADTQTGKAESTLALVADLQAILGAVNPEETGVLVSAAPVDRRRSFPKWCEQTADFTLADAGDGGEGLAAVILAEARTVGAAIDPDAVELLLARVGPNTRLLTEEVRKLATHAGTGAGASTEASTGAQAGVLRISEADVDELTPNVAEGDFFEMADAFFSGNLKRSLEALRRHFFAGGDARPVLASLQNRNRLLIQLRSLLDGGEISVGPRGVEGLKRAEAAHAARFGEAVAEKNSFNVFTQNPWYLGKLAGGRALPPLRRLIDNQRAFIDAFQEIVRRSDEQEEVLRDLVVRCLS